MTGTMVTGTRAFERRARLYAAVQAQGGKKPEGAFTVFRAEASPDGKWLACALDRHYLVLVPLERDVPKAIRVEHLVRSLAFGPDGQLAYASGGFNKQTDYLPDMERLARAYLERRLNPKTEQPAKPEKTSRRK